MSEKKFHYIYKVTHKESGKIYVGLHSTDDLNDRYFANGVYESSENNPNDWIKVNHGHKKTGTYISNALVKYGRDAFEREVIEYCSSRKKLIERESEIVTKEFIERNDTYNQRTGGYANIEFSEESKKLSENNPMHLKENREKLSESIKKSWTSQRKDELSKNNPMHNPEVAKKLTGENSVWWGRKHSEESKKKISEKNTGVKRPKEAIESQRKKIKEYWSDSERI